MIFAKGRSKIVGCPVTTSPFSIRHFGPGWMLEVFRHSHGLWAQKESKRHTCSSKRNDLNWESNWAKQKVEGWFPGPRNLQTEPSTIGRSDLCSGGRQIHWGCFKLIHR